MSFIVKYSNGMSILSCFDSLQLKLIRHRAKSKRNAKFLLLPNFFIFKNLLFVVIFNLSALHIEYPACFWFKKSNS